MRSWYRWRTSSTVKLFTYVAVLATRWTNPCSLQGNEGLTHSGRADLHLLCKVAFDDCIARLQMSGEECIFERGDYFIPSDSTAISGKSASMAGGNRSLDKSILRYSSLEPW